MLPEMANSKDCQDHEDKYILIPVKDLVTKNDHVLYGGSNTYHLQVMTNVNSFNNLSNVKVKSLSNNRKILSQEIFHVKNRSSNTHYSNVIKSEDDSSIFSLP